MATTETIIIPFQARADRAESSIKGLADSLGSVGTVVGLVGTGATATFAAMAAGASAAYAGLQQLFAEVEALNDEIGTLAAASGLSERTVRALGVAADATGKSLKDVVPRRLARSLDDLKKGSADTARLFEQVGITADNIAGQDIDQVFARMVDGLAGIEDTGQRAAVAAKLMGKQGEQLLSALSDSTALERYANASERFSLASDDAAATTTRWQQGSAALGLAFDYVKKQFIPLMDVAARSLPYVAKSIVGLVASVRNWARSLMLAAQTMGALKRVIWDGTDATAEWDALLAQSAANVETFNDEMYEGIKAIDDLVAGMGEGAPVLTDTGDRIERIATKTREATGELRDMFATLTGEAGIRAINEGVLVGVERFVALQDAARAAGTSIVMTASTSAMFYRDMGLQQQKDKALQKELNAERVANWGDFFGAVSGMAAGLTSFLEQHGKQRNRAAKVAILAAFRMQQAAGIAEAIIHTHGAITKAMDTQPFLPLGLAMAITAGTMGFANVAAIAATPPPMHIGTQMASDEGLKTLRAGEKVVTQLGDETIADSNAGVGNASGMAYAVVQVDHRAAGMMLQSQIRTPMSALQRAMRRGEPAGHSRKRGSR